MRGEICIPPADPTSSTGSSSLAAIAASLPAESADEPAFSSATTLSLSPLGRSQLIGAALIDGATDFGHEPGRLVRHQFGLAQRPVGMVECQDHPEVGGIARDPQMGIDPTNEGAADTFAPSGAFSPQH